jgi:UDP-3-O-acyl-N-acetylglucosamine deacetylase
VSDTRLCTALQLGDRRLATVEHLLAALAGTGVSQAEIWVDGVRVKTIDLKAATLKYRQVVWSTAWDVVGTHTVVVKVLGTVGRPRVDVDAFVWTWPYAAY